MELPEHRAQISDQRDLRMLDLVQVKGRQSPIRIYEIFRQNPDWVKSLKKGNQADLDKAFGLYEAGAMEVACEVYSRVIDRSGAHRYYPELCADPVLNFYHGRCVYIREQFKAGLLQRKAWEGIHVFKEK